MKPDTLFQFAATNAREQFRNPIGNALEALVDAKRFDYHSVAGEDHAIRHTVALKQIDELTAQNKALTAQRDSLLDAAQALRAAFVKFSEVLDETALKT